MSDIRKDKDVIALDKAIKAMNEEGKVEKEQKETVIDVSYSQLTGRKLKKEVEELLAQMEEKGVYPSVMVLNKKQYVSLQTARKLRRLTKPKQWQFLRKISPPENFLYYSKQHVMGVVVADEFQDPKPKKEEEDPGVPMQVL